MDHNDSSYIRLRHLSGWYHPPPNRPPIDAPLNAERPLCPWCPITRVSFLFFSPVLFLFAVGAKLGTGGGVLRKVSRGEEPAWHPLRLQGNKRVGIDQACGGIVRPQPKPILLYRQSFFPEISAVLLQFQTCTKNRSCYCVDPAAVTKQSRWQTLSSRQSSLIQETHSYVPFMTTKPLLSPPPTPPRHRPTPFSPVETL